MWVVLPSRRGAQPPAANARIIALANGTHTHRPLQVYKMLTLWGQDAVLRHCGLLHSAYSK